MIQFISPEGQVLDSLERMDAFAPFLSPRPGGAFLTYFDSEMDEQILLWLTETGGIEREVQLALEGVDYAYADGDQVKLIQFVQDGWSMEEAFIALVYDAMGNPLGVDTLLHLEMGNNDLHGGHAYYYGNGELMLLAAVVRTDLSPLQYATRVVHYEGRTAHRADPWSPGPLPAGASISFWALTAGPWGNGIASFYVSGGALLPELRTVTFDAEGVRGEGSYSVTLTADYVVNGTAVTLADGSVYICYTQNSADGSAPGGAFLTAFPLEEILAVPPVPPEVPADWKLSAYPNPFNASVRLDYAAPFAGQATLRIFDVTGRLVEERPLHITPGTGTYLWSAAGLSSGVYWAQLSTPHRQESLKLFLIR